MFLFIKIPGGGGGGLADPRGKPFFFLIFFFLEPVIDNCDGVTIGWFEF